MKGVQGDQGLRGMKGNQGDQGFKGMKGVQGDQGFRGMKGNQGDQGFKGMKGVQGDQGFRGMKGNQGDQGFKGMKGVQGDSGFKGMKGVQGDQGFKGMKGVQGDQGFKGAKGDSGFKGMKGTPGDQGFKGMKGDTGPSKQLLMFSTGTATVSASTSSAVFVGQGYVGQVAEETLYVIPIDGTMRQMDVHMRNAGCTGASCDFGYKFVVNGGDSLGLTCTVKETNMCTIVANIDFMPDDLLSISVIQITGGTGTIVAPSEATVTLVFAPDP